MFSGKLTIQKDDCYAERQRWIKRIRIVPLFIRELAFMAEVNRMIIYRLPFCKVMLKEQAGSSSAFTIPVQTPIFSLAPRLITSGAISSYALKNGELSGISSYSSTTSWTLNSFNYFQELLSTPIKIRISLVPLLLLQNGLVIDRLCCSKRK